MISGFRAVLLKVQTTTKKLPIGIFGLEFGRTRWLARRQVNLDIMNRFV